MTQASNDFSTNVGTKTRALDLWLKRVHYRLQAELTQGLAVLGLRVGAAHALVIMCETPGLTQTELAQRLAIERPNLVGIVEGLAVRGLLERRTVPDDRRSQALYPTPAGERMAAQIRVIIAAQEDRVLSRLTMAERTGLRATLAKLAQTDPDIAA